MGIVLAAIVFFISIIILSVGIVELIVGNPWAWYDIPAGMIGLILTYTVLFEGDIYDSD